MRVQKFITALALLVLTLLLALKLKLFFGFAPDLVLAALVVFGFIFGLYETIFFTAFAAWILNWQKWPGLELWILLAFALLGYFGRYFMPFARWLSLTILIIAGVLILYVVAAPAAFAANWGWLVLDAAGSAIFGLIILYLFRSIYGKR